MLYITGKEPDIIEHTCFDSPVDLGEYKKAIAKNHGGVASDYSVLILDDDSPDAINILLGCSFIGLWLVNELYGVEITSGVPSGSIDS
jgi:hypothetical protein